MSAVDFERDRLARWYAHEHLEIDPGVAKIIHLPDLPEGAGPREIRFLEINTMIKYDHSDHPLIPIDFGVDMGQDGEHQLLVIDLTPDQWERVQAEKLALPPGWSLTSKQEFPSE